MIVTDFLILDIDSGLSWYTNYNNYQTFDKRLDILYLALDPIEDLEARVSSDEKSVLIWSLDSFKERAKMNFTSQKEKDAFEDAYDKYYDKRWDEMPQIDLSIENWNDLQKKWKQIKKEKPKVLVIELDDSGPLDKVDIIGKDELSKEDLEYIKQEHEKYLNYQQARQKYIENHPDYSEVWRGPQDDEYEADIMKYYEKD